MQPQLYFPAVSEEISRCFPVFKELRPHLDEVDFVAQVCRQMAASYQIIGLMQAGLVVSAAGYRLAEHLAWGKILYVDDLATLSAYRGQGCAQKLLAWLINYARAQQCQGLHLDSGHQRHSAHKLYHKMGLSITSHHFALVF